MTDLLLAFAAATLAATAVGTLAILPRMRRIPRIRVPTEPPGNDTSGGAPSQDPVDLPTAAVIVAGKDEADSIEGALRSLASQANERIRIIAVNDRSADGTAEILDRLAAEFEGLDVLHVDELPGGWLGKNHALHRGAVAASAGSSPPDFLLFTDADVHFVPKGLEAVVDHAAAEGLDHLAGAPRVEARSWALAGQIASFGVLFGLFTRPWSVPNPKSRSYVGIGALNLVRRTAYEGAGGHQAISLRIDDDLRLGKRIKESGGRSAFSFADGVASLTWYPTLPHMLRGLHKNAFAGIDFRLSLAVLATVFLLAAFVGPFAVALAPPGLGVSIAARALCAATSALHLIGAAESARNAGLPRSSALFFPLGILLFLAVLWRSALGAILTGRIVWRGTSYRLTEVRGAARR
ncbi:MAG: glycosyltransferase [Planctomycetota bacterium]